MSLLSSAATATLDQFFFRCYCESMEGQISPVRRVGVIGDVHTEDLALEAALTFLRTVSGLDALFCTGDIVTGTGQAGRCCQLLREHKVLTVRGNHDRWFFGEAYEQLLQTTPPDEITGMDRLFLHTLPVTLSFDTPRGPLLLCHGTDTNDMDSVYPKDSEVVLSANHRLHRLFSEGYYRIMLGGHTHQRMVRTFGHLTIINAGTLRADKNPCFLTADFESGEVRFYDIAPDSLAITPAATFRLP